MSDRDDNADGEIVHHDEYGRPFVLDEAGNECPPMQSGVVSEPGEFTTYDTSQGHCGLCGSLGCRGGCFR